MSGRLVKLDDTMRRALERDRYARASLMLSGQKSLDDASMTVLINGGGIPASKNQFLAMPVQCTCGSWVRLGTAIDDGACNRCGFHYWDADFPGALRALLRMDWPAAFDAVVTRQGYELASPVLAPLRELLEIKEGGEKAP